MTINNILYAISRLKSSATFRILNFWRSTRHIVNFIIEPKVTFKKKIVLFYFNNYEDVKSGGILSILFLMSETEKFLPDATVLPVTLGVPCYEKITMVENPYRIINLVHYRKQIREESEVLIHVPEVFFVQFCHAVLNYKLTFTTRKITVNILNQNQLLMPGCDVISKYQHLFKEITVTLAFKANSGEDYPCIKFKPHFLSTWFYNDHIENIDFEDKEDLVIISNDPNPLKSQIIGKLEANGFRTVIVDNMPFEKYKSLLRKAKWTISFGEGYDGYSIGANLKGGIGFGVFQKEFFPENMYPLSENFFLSYEEMADKILERIKSFNSKREYQEHVAMMRKKILENNSPSLVTQNLSEYYQKVMPSII